MHRLHISMFSLFSEWKPSFPHHALNKLYRKHSESITFTSY